MTKNTFETIFKSKTEDVTNVAITTNIAHGLGINGVEYSVFNTYEDYNRDDTRFTTKIEVNMHDDFVEFDIDSMRENRYGKTTKTFSKVFVPYDNIVTISFMYK